MSPPDAVVVPLTKEQRELVTEAAKRSGLTLRQWIKVTIIKAAQHEIGSGEPSP
jgi:uncharacterized protein (DUF1778 family)